MHLMHVRRLRLFVYYIEIRPVKRLNRELYYFIFTMRLLLLFSPLLRQGYHLDRLRHMKNCSTTTVGKTKLTFQHSKINSEAK